MSGQNEPADDRRTVQLTPARLAALGAALASLCAAAFWLGHLSGVDRVIDVCVR